MKALMRWPWVPMGYAAKEQYVQRWAEWNPNIHSHRLIRAGVEKPPLPIGDLLYKFHSLRRHSIHREQQLSYLAVG